MFSFLSCLPPCSHVQVPDTGLCCLFHSQWPPRPGWLGSVNCFACDTHASSPLSSGGSGVWPFTQAFHLFIGCCHHCVILHELGDWWPRTPFSALSLDQKLFSLYHADAQRVAKLKIIFPETFRWYGKHIWQKRNSSLVNVYCLSTLVSIVGRITTVRGLVKTQVTIVGPVLEFLI